MWGGVCETMAAGGEEYHRFMAELDKSGRAGLEPETVAGLRASADLAWERFHEAIARADGNEQSDPNVARAWSVYQHARDVAEAREQEMVRPAADSVPPLPSIPIGTPGRGHRRLGPQLR